MRTFISLLALGLGITACSQQPAGTYTIVGNAPGIADGTQIVVINGQNKTIDTTTVANGVFRLSGKADSLQAVTIFTAERSRNVSASAYLEPGTIEVNLIEHTAKGTPLNDEDAALSEQLEQLLQNPENETNGVIDQLFADIYAKHPNDPLGLEAFKQLAYEMDYDTLVAALENAGPVIKGDARVQRTLEAKRTQQATAVGQPYIDIVGQDALSPEVTRKLSDILAEGKPVLVDFWASWCGPCRREIPYVKANAEKFKGKVNVVGIAVWDKLSDTQQAIGELGITWPVIFNEREATDTYGVEGIPHIMLIGPDGTILSRNLRGDFITTAIELALAK